MLNVTTQNAILKCDWNILERTAWNQCGIERSTQPVRKSIMIQTHTFSHIHLYTPVYSDNNVRHL